MLKSKRDKDTARKTPKASSSALRNAFAAENGSSPSRSQFVDAPRFSVRKPGPDAAGWTPPPPAATPALARSRAVERVDEALSGDDGGGGGGDDDDEMLDGSEGDVATSEEHHPPSTMPPPPPRTAPRFVLPPPTPTPSPHDQPATRPSFLRPPASLSESSAPPPPELFSPHRRGQKFVPGGMAAEVRRWIFEAGQSAVSGQRERGLLRIKIDGVGGDGPWFGEGLLASGERGRVLLVGGESERGRVLGEGRVVEIRPPMWDVEVAGVVWTVGVDWHVIEQ
ncbi:hypothetical protein LTR50_003532 [Elasticomyces elasticus]|nr:hypothetical protein LTR50_003532 [Elasticomyces elasticus]